MLNGSVGTVRAGIRSFSGVFPTVTNQVAVVSSFVVALPAFVRLGVERSRSSGLGLVFERQLRFAHWQTLDWRDDDFPRFLTPRKLFADVQVDVTFNVFQVGTNEFTERTTVQFCFASMSHHMVFYVPKTRRLKAADSARVGRKTYRRNI